MVTEIFNTDNSKAEFIYMKAVDTQQKIINYLNKHDISKICYAHKSRVKSENGLVEKVIRKKLEKPQYCMEDITDVIGVRFVVLFKKDIVTTIKEIITILVGSQDDTNPFINCEITEAIYYIGDASSSNITSKLEDCFNEIGINIRVQEIKEGYSSFHIVCHLKSISSNIIPSGLRIPVEIQVRTVFEDAWGEIDHRHRYGIREGKETVSHPTLNQHLSTLKKFVDACVDYADIIVEESRIEINPKNSAKILDNPQNIVNPKYFFEGDLGDEKVEKYIELISNREKAILNGNHLDLIACAQSFLELRVDHLDSINLELFDKFAFYCCINEALCHLSINKEANLLSAKKLYLHLHELDKSNCLVTMRLGQALGKTGDLDKGIINLKNSFSLAKENVSKFPVKDSDIQYVLSKAPKIIGYYIWLKIESVVNESDDSIVVSMYHEAYTFTKAGLEYIAESHCDLVEYTNNLLFYLTEIYKRTKSLEHKSLLLKELELLESSYKETKTAEAKTLHTFLNAYVSLQDRDKSLACADVLEEKIYAKDYDFDVENAIEMLQLIRDVRSNS